MKSLEKITVDPAVMDSKACIRGMRVAVGTIRPILQIFSVPLSSHPGFIYL